MSRSTCPHCGDSVALTNRNRLRKHGPRRGLTCSGSGKLDRAVEVKYEQTCAEYELELAGMRAALLALEDFLNCYTEEVLQVRFEC